MALCSSNLPDTTLSPNQDEQADDHFNTVLYTANNQTAQSITGVGFQPDWLWFKQRSRADAHALFDTSRGIDKDFRITTDDEFDDSNSETLVTAVGADGFTLGTDAQAWVNYQSDSMVAWLWKANGSTSSSNTNGTITSTVQVNQTAGFSIVLYTGTGSVATYGHGLGTKPDLIITKERNNAENWLFYTHADDQAYLYLNLTNARSTGNNQQRFGNDSSVVQPTSTIVSIGTAEDINTSSSTYVAYCLEEIEGYSKFGGYTAIGDADGT